MKTFLSFILFFLFSLSLNGQIFEVNKTIGGEFLSEITALPDGSGFLGLSENSSIIKVTPTGDVIWKKNVLSLFPDGPFKSAYHLHYLLLPNGNIFVSLGEFECDICFQTIVIMLDSKGDIVWTELIEDPPTFTNCGGAGASVFFNNEIFSIGRDSLWRIGLDGEVKARLKHSIPLTSFFSSSDENKSSLKLWNNSNSLFLSEPTKLFSIDIEGRILDRITIPRDFVKGFSTSDSLNYLVFELSLIHI